MIRISLTILGKENDLETYEPNQAKERDDSIDQEIRLENARTARIEAEAKKQRQESRETRRSILRENSQVPSIVKMAVPVALAAVVVLIVCVVLPLCLDNQDNQILTASDLKSVVNVDDLSTIEYTYHGIAEKHSSFLWLDRIDYRVKYTARIRVSYSLSSIEFEINDTDKAITAYLPEATIGEPNVSDFGYLPENAIADIPDVIALCQEDAISDLDYEELEKEGNAGLQNAVRALTLPLIGKDYKLDFKPLSEYAKGAED